MDRDSFNTFWQQGSITSIDTAQWIYKRGLAFKTLVECDVAGHGLEHFCTVISVVLKLCHPKTVADIDMIIIALSSQENFLTYCGVSFRNSSVQALNETHLCELRIFGKWRNSEMPALIYGSISRLQY